AAIVCDLRHIFAHFGFGSQRCYERSAQDPMANENCGGHDLKYRNCNQAGRGAEPPPLASAVAKAPETLSACSATTRSRRTVLVLLHYKNKGLLPGNPGNPEGAFSTCPETRSRRCDGRVIPNV